MPRATPSVDAVRIDRTTLARLDVIAMLAFPDGSIGVSALRSEARRGRLAIWRVAGKDMTTLAEIERMVEQCRVKQCLPVSGSSPPRTTEPRSGSSRTDDGELALASALQLAQRLKQSLQPTSPASTTRPRSRNVVPIKRE